MDEFFPGSILHAVADSKDGDRLVVRPECAATLFAAALAHFLHESGPASGCNTNADGPAELASIVPILRSMQHLNSNAEHIAAARNIEELRSSLRKLARLRWGSEESAGV